MSSSANLKPFLCTFYVIFLKMNLNFLTYTWQKVWGMIKIRICEIATRVMEKSFPRWTGVSCYHKYQHNEWSTEWRVKFGDVVHGTSWLPLVFYGEPVMENVVAHLDGTAHHLGCGEAHWTLPPGKKGFSDVYIFLNSLHVMWKGLLAVTNSGIYHAAFQFHSSLHDYCECIGKPIGNLGPN